MKHKENKQQIKYGPRKGTPYGKGIIGAYPEVLDEFTTLDQVLRGRSIARFGDGELNIVTTGTCISQREVPDKMREEMRDLLVAPGKCLIGIPNVFSHTPKRTNWATFACESYVHYLGMPKYVSSFITRPDSAPWIDVPGYWERIESLWRNKEVMLVYGGPDSKSLKPEWLMERGARNVIPIVGKRTGAYCGIDELEKQIDRPKCPVILCLGPTATILAWRLAQKGVWAVDLGHVGMFMKSKGAYAVKPVDLVTPEYGATLEATHAKYLAEGVPWGRSGRKFVREVTEFYARLGADSLLDYGSGQETLRQELAQLDPPITRINVTCYDPGIPNRAALPKPADLVTCTEVLEHVEPEQLSRVLGHINALALKGAFLTISCDHAGELLADGRNAHLIVEDYEWWLNMLQGWSNWYVDKREIREREKRLLVWLVKKAV